MQVAMIDPGIQTISGGVTAALGFRAGATSAGVKAGPARLDLAVVCADKPGVAAALFTQCAVVAAPVILSRDRVAGGRAQGIIMNSGNANACVGPNGMVHARQMADAAAAHLGVDPELMLVESTGVIGVPLPIDRICNAIPTLKPGREGADDAARAIMTTDTVPKQSAVAVEIGGRRITIGGMAKGSGMIHPNMATMLAVVTTDAPIDAALARSCLKQATDRSFNQVSVDADTSTNDMVALFASGAAGGEPIRAGTRAAAELAAALERVCVELARAIARDGEGATRLVEASVEKASSEEDARRAARSIVMSNLVKAAIYGRDPNWGRIISAVGNAGVPLDQDAIDIYVGDQQVASQGAPVDFSPAAVADAMGAEEVVLRVVMNQGGASAKAWGCDLTEEYVHINADYTT
jgi:glutamate N-acetyltransferase / amino-acid N-acetyltransferase